MKNLISAVTAYHETQLSEFIAKINKIETIKDLYRWQYNNLIPKGKDMSKFTFESLKSYLIKRKEKATAKNTDSVVANITDVFDSGELIKITISVEWRKNRTWGNNPNAEAVAEYKDKEGNRRTINTKSGSISGCGYDKGSTAVAEALNQIKPMLKLLYMAKDNNVNSNNHDLLGYGSGYWILPQIEGGVGVSCYDAIFNKVGFTFKSVARGKNYDVYTIEQLKTNN